MILRVVCPKHGLRRLLMGTGRGIVSLNLEEDKKIRSYFPQVKILTVRRDCLECRRDDGTRDVQEQGGARG